MDLGSLLIRTDSSPSIGAGHLMRCLALAQGWQQAGGQTVMALAGETAAEERLMNEGIDVVCLDVEPGSQDDASSSAALAHEVGVSWLVVDGYHFGSSYQRAIKRSGVSLLVIDDYGQADHYWADIVLNQNLYASDDLYPGREPYTRLLCGIRYVLLRRAFREWVGWERPVPEVACKVLITLGGGDPQNVTTKVIRALGEVQMKEWEGRVLLGDFGPHREAVIEAVRNSRVPLSVASDVRTMADEMAWADLAVLGSGVTALEAAFMGLPSLLVVLAENQRCVAESLDIAGAAASLGWHAGLTPEDIARAISSLALDKEGRARMADRGRSLVDGDGVDRVVMQLMGNRLRLRPVRESDCRLLWEWANDGEVRESSFSREPIPWEAHVRWFRGKLYASGVYHFLALDEEDRPVGQVRFDPLGRGEVDTNVSMAEAFRGRGLGSLLLDMAVRKILTATPTTVAHAYVKSDNIASRRAFLRAGFRERGEEDVEGHKAVHFVRAGSD